MFQIPYQKDSKFLDDCPVILPLAPMKRVLFAAECILSFLEGNLATVRLIYVQHILAIPLLGFHPAATKAPVHKRQTCDNVYSALFGDPRSGSFLVWWMDELATAYYAPLKGVSHSLWT